MSYLITQNYITNNRPETPLKLDGAVCHATDTPGATDENERDYFNNGYRSASAHAFIDWDSITETIPENEVAWHAGPRANSHMLGWELCEPRDDDPDRFRKFAEVWNRAVWYAAYKFVQYGWETGPGLWSHKGISQRYGETDHTDPYGYFNRYGKTWQNFLDAVDVEMKAIKGGEPTTVVTPIEPTHIEAIKLAAPMQPTPVQAPLIFSFPNNAKIVNDDLFLRDVNGNKIPGRYAAVGDPITVLETFSTGLALIEYPTPGGVVRGFVRNDVNCIAYTYADLWRNGSTNETVYTEDGSPLGTIFPGEKATPMYRKNNLLHVAYDTSKGKRSKSGYVYWNGWFNKF